MSAQEKIGNSGVLPFEHPRAASAAIILAALYAPQSWLFLINYPWNDYHIFWLRFFPGLPAFLPAAWLFHPNEIALLIGSWSLTAAIGFGLFALSKRSALLFYGVATLSCLLSIGSALFACAAFRA